MTDILDEHSIKTLDTVNDFPHIGLVYYENSGENLLRFYLEQIFRIQTQTNIKKEFLVSPINNIFPKKDQDLNLFWVIPSDYPIRESYEYETVDISLAIILVRNPIDVIMSLLLKESLLLEEALKKADEHIVLYEELLEDPTNILKKLCQFMLGIKIIEKTKLDYCIQKAIKMEVDQKYFPFNILLKKNEYINDNMINELEGKFTKLSGLMKKFKYSSDDNDNDEKNESNFEEAGKNFIKQFNIDNFIKSVELQDNIANSILTSSYYTLRLS